MSLSSPDPTLLLCRFAPLQKGSASPLLGAVVFGIATGFGALGCSVRTGSGIIETETRQVEAATAIDVCCGFEVSVETGKAASAKITTDTELLEKVEVEEVDGRLVLGWDDDFTVYQPSHGVKIQLVLPELTSLTASGGSKIEASEITGESSTIELSGGSSLSLESCEVESLTVEASGASTLELGEVTAPALELNLSGDSVCSIEGLSSETLTVTAAGGSSVTAAGIGDELELDASGASQMDLIELAARRVSATASGSSTLVVDARERLEIDASGGSSVKYRREPPELVVTLSGGSTAGEN
jgi:Putative auto-transporter adhesin, head GIN domain